MPTARALHRVYLEIGTKKTFAGSLDWPGWGRFGRGEAAALAALGAYAGRYAAVVKEAGFEFPIPTDAGFEVVERLPGSTTTDFGAPDAIATADAEPLSAADAARLSALVRAAWAAFDRGAASTPAALRKGPRGGGRDRDAMIAQVVNAEAAYARKLGIKHPPPAISDRDGIAALRGLIADVLGAPSDGSPPVPRGWPVRYGARRIAWHVLDHLWEMEDRST
jgi:hypothetical protein